MASVVFASTGLGAAAAALDAGTLSAATGLGVGALAAGALAGGGFGFATTDGRANLAAPALLPKDEYRGLVLSSGTSTFLRAVVGRADEERLNSLTAVGAAF